MGCQDVGSETGGHVLVLACTWEQEFHSGIVVLDCSFTYTAQQHNYIIPCH